MLKCLLGFCLFSFVICVDFRSFVQKKNILPILPISCNFSTNYTFNLNQSVVYVLEYTSEIPTLPARVTTESYDVDENYPLLVAVWKQKEVISWEVPHVVELSRSLQKTLAYKKVSRTLCPQIIGNDSTSSTFFITLSSDSPATLTFSVSVVHVEDFSVKLGTEVKFSLSPSESRFYSFKFPRTLSSAVLTVNSDSSVCMSMSIQNYSCPIYDQEDNLKYRGYWETITTKGGMLLTKESFLQREQETERLFIVFIVHSDDEDCSGHPGGIENRNKTVTFKVNSSISYEEYLLAMAAVIVAFALMYIGAFAVLVMSYRRKWQENPMLEDCEYEDQAAICSISKSVQSESHNINSDPDDPGSSRDLLPNQPVSRWNVTCVNDLAKKDHDVLRRRSNLYFWNLITVATFYSLPVVQLVLTYQRVLNQTGNQDLCYYNFLCSHRLGIFSDFNHIFSNIGYILLGMLFLLIVYRRERSEAKKATGIPQHYGLYYTLGGALFMEGVMSGCYHFCPNHSNFQFDTSFMYILAMISMIKIYQSRHPDINASAYTAFGVLALVIALGMCGVLYISYTFYVVFSVFHVCICLFMSAQIYYMGQWNLDMGGKRVHEALIERIRWGRENQCQPMYPSRMALLILGNICNWALIGSGLFSHLGDFATYLLSILMCNLLIYFIFYILMKLISGEKILTQPLIYTILALTSWVAACYFFYHKSISWKLTPAQSRTFNQPCMLFDFYDKHDIWHFLSAMSMFFSFMVLLTLDDDIADVPRTSIAVF